MKKFKSDYIILCNHFLVIFTPVFLGFIMLSGLFYFREIKHYYRTIQILEENEMQAHEKIIARSFKEISKDLIFLSKISSLDNFLNSSKKEEKLKAEKDILNFCIKKAAYDQVRYIDSSGMEVIRVNYNKGNPILVKEKDLQSKTHRYYFKDTMALSNNQVFVSPMDLNVEFKEVEIPHKPMIRFGTPVFNAKGEKKGVIIFNYFGKEILDKFQSRNLIERISCHHEAVILNNDKYCLLCPNKETEWGFMYGKPPLFDKKHPVASEAIFSKETGQLILEKGLFTFRTLYPGKESQIVNGKMEGSQVVNVYNKENGDYFWKIVFVIPKAQLDAKKREILKLAGIFFVPFSCIWLVASFFIAVLLKKRRERMETLRKYTEKLKVLNANKDKLFSLVSHDLRGPFTYIAGTCELLSQEIESMNKDQIRKFTKGLYDSSIKFLNLLENLLKWARLQLKQVKANPEKLDLKCEIDAVLSLFRENLKIKELDAVLDIQEGIIVDVDKEMLDSVVRNLLSNAIKFSNRSGKIEISAKIMENLVEVRVSDTGVGMNENQLQRVFSIDYKSTKGTEGEKGSGLGLVLCREFIEMHGGTIRVESLKDKGTTFYFTLPFSN